MARVSHFVFLISSRHCTPPLTRHDVANGDTNGVPRLATVLDYETTETQDYVRKFRTFVACLYFRVVNAHRSHCFYKNVLFFIDLFLRGPFNTPEYMFLNEDVQ